MSPEGSPSLPVVLATLRAFVTRAGAERAVLVLDQGDDALPAVVTCPARGEARVSEGQEVIVVPDPDGAGGTPLALPDVRSFPPLTVDALRGEVTGPIGAFEHLGRAVRDLVTAFPGRSVLTVEWESSDPAAPLALAARPGEEMVLALGKDHFELPPAWPPA